MFVYSSLRLLLYKERNVSAGLSGRRIWVLSAFVLTPEGGEDGGATCKHGSWHHDKTLGMNVLFSSGWNNNSEQLNPN